MGEIFSVDYITAAITTSIAYMVGGIDTAFEVLIVMIGLDIFTGIIKAFKNKQYTSRDLREGLVHKVGYLVVIIICYQTDVLLFGGELITRTAAVIFYVAVEISSIIENLGQMGVPIPSIISKRLKRLNEMSEQVEIDKETKEEQK